MVGQNQLYTILHSRNASYAHIDVVDQSTVQQQITKDNTKFKSGKN